MLSKLKKSSIEGFTIIEVMIVLAIAGLIILIVLLAVPALQRNSRNAGIKSDASAVTGAVSTFESDNDGANVTGISATGSVTGASGTPVQARIQGGTTIDAALSAQPSTVAAGAAIPAGHVQFWLGHNCAGAASGRAVAVWYSIETNAAATGANNHCIDS